MCKNADIIVGEPINRNCLNLSKTKQMYSFPKAERFPRSLYIGNGCQAIYNIPDSKSRRGASFGYGTKSDFTKGSRNVCQTFYSAKIDFNSTYHNSPIYSFGVSREKMQKAYDKNVPGPGKYMVLKKFGSEAPKYSFKGAHESFTKKNDISPGPSAYSPKVGMDPNGTYMWSKYKNVVSINFGRNHTDRFKSSNTSVTPASNAYKQEGLIGRKIFESRFRSSRNPFMGSRYKIGLSKFSNPGPGSYDSFSEFGMYSKCASRTQSHFASKVASKYQSSYQSKVINNSNENSIEEEKGDNTKREEKGPIIKEETNEDRNNTNNKTEKNNVDNNINNAEENNNNKLIN